MSQIQPLPATTHHLRCFLTTEIAMRRRNPPETRSVGIVAEGGNSGYVDVDVIVASHCVCVAAAVTQCCVVRKISSSDLASVSEPRVLVYLPACRPVQQVLHLMDVDDSVDTTRMMLERSVDQHLQQFACVWEVATVSYVRCDFRNTHVHSLSQSRHTIHY